MKPFHLGKFPTSRTSEKEFSLDGISLCADVERPLSSRVAEGAMLTKNLPAIVPAKTRIPAPQISRRQSLCPTFGK